LFVVRNVANLVPPHSPDGTYHGVSAALEFGVGALRVKHVPKTEVPEFPGKIRTPRKLGFEREAKIHGVDLQLVALNRPPKQVARPRTILRPPVLAPRASR
jgi:Carbonic anhydrase